MLNKGLISTLILLGFSFACSFVQTRPKDIPIVVSEGNDQAIDIDLVISNAGAEVEKVLPDANLTFFSLIAECEGLSELQGEIRLHFSQTRQTILGERVYTARIVIDTSRQKLQIDVQDETEQYLTTDKLELQGLSVLEIATFLKTHLVSKDMCNDIVVLTRINTIGPWYVRCGPPDEVFIECIEIDPESGDIIVLR